MVARPPEHRSRLRRYLQLAKRRLGDPTGIGSSRSTGEPGARDLDSDSVGRLLTEGTPPDPSRPALRQLRTVIDERPSLLVPHTDRIVDSVIEQTTPTPMLAELLVTIATEDPETLLAHRDRVRDLAVDPETDVSKHVSTALATAANQGYKKTVLELCRHLLADRRTHKLGLDVLVRITYGPDWPWDQFPSDVITALTGDERPAVARALELVGRYPFLVAEEDADRTVQALIDRAAGPQSERLTAIALEASTNCLGHDPETYEPCYQVIHDQTVTWVRGDGDTPAGPHAGACLGVAIASECRIVPATDVPTTIRLCNAAAKSFASLPESPWNRTYFQHTPGHDISASWLTSATWHLEREHPGGPQQPDHVGYYNA